MANMGRLSRATMLVLWLAYASLSSSSKQPPGHLQPLGSHRLPEGEIDVVDGFLEPAAFFEKYVKGVDGSKPVLFRGAARGIPAYSLWNDNYLGSTYGKLSIDAEIGKKENRSQDMEEMPLFRFLQQYQEREIYMVQDVLDEMKVDLTMPRCLQCGGFQNQLSTSVIWFSSGGTKSVLHNDDVDNINCIFDGEKDMIMIDKKYNEAVERDEWVRDRGFSRVDVDKVDMNKFPGLGEVSWWTAHMTRGDCLFIPIRWYHMVHSSRTRNLAVNLWFSHLHMFDYDDCKDKELTEHKPLENYDIWGMHGDTPQNIRSMLFDGMEQLEHITVADLIENWSPHVEGLDPKDVQEIFEALDSDKDMILTWKEVYSADMVTMVDEFGHILGPLGGFEEEEGVEDESSDGVRDEL